MGEPTPKPPDGAPKYIIEGLQKQSPEVLEELSGYCESLAAEKVRELEAQLEEKQVEIDETPDEWEPDEWEETVADVEAPPKACITTKTIDGRDYYYYQWREGSSIKSEYIAPVTPAE